MNQEEFAHYLDSRARTDSEPAPSSPLSSTSLTSWTILDKPMKNQGDDDEDQIYQYGEGSVPASSKYVAILPAVEAISNRALWGCFRLKRVDFEQGGNLTNIQEYAFSSCAALESIILPSTLIDIGPGAFHYCHSLLEITIPDSVKTLGKSAFEHCTRLAKIRLSEQLTKIEPHTFLNCKALPAMVLPNSIQSVGEGAFENCCYLLTVRLPDSLQRVDRRAFCSCYELSQIENFPSGIDLGEQALESTAVASSIVSEASLTRDEDNPHLFPEDLHVLVPKYTYHSNGSVADRPDDFAVAINSTCIVGRNLDGNVLEASNSFVPQNAFANCVHLVYVHLPDSLTFIGNYAFQNCSTLEEVIIPGSVKSIGDRAFQGCKGLKSLILPPSVTQMGPAVFEDCSMLEQVSLPRWLDTIPPRCFRMCVKLEFVRIPRDGALRLIGDAAFHLCRSLENFEFPNTITTIDPGAFGNCMALKTLRLPSSVKRIRLFAFAGCRSLTSVQLPKHENTNSGDLCTTKDRPLVVENGAFAGCGSLSTVEIPEVPLAVWPMLLKQFQTRQGSFYRKGLSPAGAKTCAFTFLQTHFYQMFEELPVVPGEERWCAESSSGSQSKGSFPLQRFH